MNILYNYKMPIFNIIRKLIKRKLLTSAKNPYKQFEDENQFPAPLKSLFSQDVGYGHIKAQSYLDYDATKFKNYFKFAFVRNPWDRFFSAYTYLKKGGRNKFDQAWSNENLSQIESFEEFVLKMNRDYHFRQKVLKYTHFIPQYHYICDKNKKILMDYIGKFENINKDYDCISDKLNIGVPLEHLNKSTSDNYRDYYTPEMRGIVSKLYRDDIRLFGYEF